jgi:hypothetical protein
MRRCKMQGVAGALWAAAFLFPQAATPQAEKRLSAREIFYSAPSEAAPAKKPAVATPQKKAPQETAKAKPATPAPSPTFSPTAVSPGARVVPVAYAPADTTPLGIRYSILKRNGADWAETSSDSVFRSGDRIRLRVEVNASGYLYVISRGSSGTWKPLFPSAEVAQGDNRAEKGRTYDLPPGYVFTFDEQAGQEKLFIVFSRQPEPNLEGLVYSLSSGPKPAASTESVEFSGGKVLLASNMVNINDGLIQKMRNVYARDLIIEKVDESSPAQAQAKPKETAVYVVNPARSGESRVVADVTLDHK